MNDQVISPAEIALDPPPRTGIRGGGWLTRWIIQFGRSAEAGVEHAGKMTLLVWRIGVYAATGRISFREVLKQAHWMGVHSIPIVVLSAILSGVVTAQQGGYLLNPTLPRYVLGNVVSSSVILELGPLLTAIVLIARVGARVTAEYGTMQVSEQIDAYYALGRDPVRYLAGPRVIAGLLVVPMLVCVANVTGIFSGMVAAKATYGLGFETFLYGARIQWDNWNLVYSLSKAFAFGFVISLISVYMGFQARGGAEGVGRTTTASVMFMTVALLALNALFPPLLLN